jgi:hypothetical protein
VQLGFISDSKETPNLHDIADVTRILLKNTNRGSTHQVKPYLVVVDMGGVGVLGEHGVLSIHLCGFLEGLLARWSPIPLYLQPYFVWMGC